MTPQALSLPVPPGSSDEAPALTATHGNCATSGPGGPTRYRVRCTYEDDYSGNVLDREYQPHMSTDIVFNAWIEDDVATWPTPDLATQAALEQYEPGDFEVEPAIGAARPALDVVYVRLLAEADGTTPDDFTLACRALSHLFGRNHARQYQA